MNDAEHSLFLRYPQCRFLAVDPASDVNKELYERRIPGSRFVQAAVKGKTGVSRGVFWQSWLSQLSVYFTIVPAAIQ
jgi:hypothetical protein